MALAIALAPPDPITISNPPISASYSSKLCVLITYPRSISSHRRTTTVNPFKISIVPTENPARKSQYVDNNGDDEDISTLWKGGQVMRELIVLNHLTDGDTGPQDIDLADPHAYARLLKRCTKSKAVVDGKRVHGHMIKNGFGSNIFLGNNLVNMYAKCGVLNDARQVFDKMPDRNAISWTTMMAGYAQSGDGKETLKLFSQMQLAGLKSDQFTFSTVLWVCANLEALEEGRQVHKQIIEAGFESHAFVGSSLIDMYVKCGSINDAEMAFEKMLHKDVVSWTTIISGYAQNECGEEALKLFSKMQHTGIMPNQFTSTSVLRACARLAALELGKQVHNNTIKNGLKSDVFVGSALVDMYSKCGNLDDAFQVFDKMSKRNIVSWNAMIWGYAWHGYGDEALKFFQEMLRTGIRPDKFSFTSVLSVCANLASVGRGKQVHAQIINNGLESDVSVGNALVDMYANCGSIVDAHKIFEELHKRDVVSWNAIIGGYAQHGHGKKALGLFQQMQQEGMKPNHITFVCVLSACSHAGLVDIGCDYFYSMNRDHGIMPRVEHYACMVDLLGRAGCLNQAKNLIDEMPFKPSAFVWRNLLGACRIHGNIELGKHAAERIIQLEPHDPAAYVLLSNIYSAAGSWDDAENVRKMMEERGVRKEPGCSWIEIKNRVHKFIARDKSHPQTEEIYAKLEELTREMKVAEYVPDTNFVLHEVKQQQKEQFLCQHSEKLAIALALISTYPETPIRIMKNLRVCGDCHTAMKFISKIAMREIVVRDANRFHHIKDGKCSCGDYW